VVVTNDDGMNERLRLIRNHGMKNRDEIAMLGCNSRLDSVQAVVGNWLIGHTHEITQRRIDNAAYYDAGFSGLNGLRVPPRRKNVRHVYHLYMVFAERRDELYRFCLDNGIEAKIHYPIPLYQQEGLKHLGYAPGRFPVTDRHAREVISFPVDQHLSRAQQDRVIEAVRKFHHGC
jgi:dTDP-4-amino-4,6-dideoxygalactose transaminase